MATSMQKLEQPQTESANGYLCCPALNGQEEREEKESEKGKESAEELVFVSKKVKKVNHGDEACRKVLAIEMEILSQRKRLRVCARK